VKRIVIIGSGVGSLAAACLLGKAGYAVTVLEKNEQLGGRAGQLQAKGFTFDTGPSWYLMPEVFEHFFELLDEQIDDFLELTRLSPSFRVFSSGRKPTDITGNDAATFENIEKGAGEQLRRFLDDAADTYKLAMRVAYRDLSLRTVSMLELTRQSALPFTAMHSYVQRYFTHPLLQQIVEYPLVFLGANPYRDPALYSLLDHTTLSQGVRYPKGGMYKIVEALVAIGTKHGVIYKTSTPAEHILVENGRAAGVVVGGKTLPADIVISGADIWHTETALLDKPHRDHSDRYWATRKLAPSALLLYLGADRTYPSLAHHNLLFGSDWRQNFAQIFDVPGLPQNPSLYICVTSKTDPSVAPKNHENLFVLVPVGAGIDYTDKQLQQYIDRVLQTIETEMGLPDLRKALVYQQSFCVRDFAERYNSLGGTGLGLAHTLRQSAVFRPKNASNKVKNLYYVGANVHPGIGIPPALISAELLYNKLI